MEKLTKKEIKRRNELTSLKVNFNDVCMRELGLGLTEDELVYEMDTMEILQFRERFLQYSEDYMPRLQQDRMEFNLLENNRLFDVLFGRWLTKYAERVGWELCAIYSSNIRNSVKGYSAFSIIENGRSVEYLSDPYTTESVRTLNLICKLNKSTHFYDFDMFDQKYLECKRV